MLVAAGDDVEVDDPIIEFETEKAVVEIPSPFKGRVAEILVAEGDELKVGDVIAKIDAGDGEDKKPRARGKCGPDRKRAEPESRESGPRRKLRQEGSPREDGRAKGAREEKRKERREAGKRRQAVEPEGAEAEGQEQCKRARPPEPSRKKPGRGRGAAARSGAGLALRAAFRPGIGGRHPCDPAGGKPGIGSPRPTSKRT